MMSNLQEWWWAIKARLSCILHIICRHEVVWRCECCNCCMMCETCSLIIWCRMYDPESWGRPH